MARDIFNRRTDVFGGSFAADEADLSFPAVGERAGADVGLLVQRLAVTYQQQVTRLYEVGRPAVYYVGGRTAGDATVDRVVGPRVVQDAFYLKYGDVCQARKNALEFSIRTGCGTGVDDTVFEGFVSYSAYFCVITSIGLGVQATDMLINESLRIMFSSFQYTQSRNMGVANSFVNAAAAASLGTVGESVAAAAAAVAAAATPGAVAGTAQELLAIDTNLARTAAFATAPVA